LRGARLAGATALGNTVQPEAARNLVVKGLLKGRWRLCFGLLLIDGEFSFDQWPKEEV
jgi:hypothetical protein